ncbi:MAG: InlB B-repeat-containing protein [Bacteroidales bacterium]|nr:InlB B-repeat-containing protein [Bacteroidales bacterium]
MSMKTRWILLFSVALVAICGCNKKESYTVSFDSNGGEGVMNPQLFTEGQQQALSKNAFTREGYLFSEWNGDGVKYLDEQLISVHSDMTLYAIWIQDTTQVEPSAPTYEQHNGHDYVDLGLPSGTKWATCNVGATTPEGYGDYYAWGETTIKTYYEWSNYHHCNGGQSSDMTKYCNKYSYGYNGYTDNLSVLEAADDVAYVAWGGNWRMPTMEEMNELKNCCSTHITSVNGIYCYICTGPNGNSIFLPMAGYRDGRVLNSSGLHGEGYYWSSSLDVDQPNSAWYLTRREMAGKYRYYGMTVRPVWK